VQRLPRTSRRQPQTSSSASSSRATAGCPRRSVTHTKFSLSSTDDKQAVERAVFFKDLSLQLAGHDQAGAQCTGIDRCSICSTYFVGLQILYSCCDEWISTFRPFEFMPDWVLGCLRSLPQTSSMPSTRSCPDSLIPMATGRQTTTSFKRPVTFRSQPCCGRYISVLVGSSTVWLLALVS